MSKKFLAKKEEANIKDVINVDQGENTELLIVDELDSDPELTVADDVTHNHEVVVVEDKDEVILVENTNVPIEPKKVKIKLREEHKCNIGGEWYYFSKNSVYTVPENVKAILTEADLLLPL